MCLVARIVVKFQSLFSQNVHSVDRGKYRSSQKKQESTKGNTLFKQLKYKLKPTKKDKS